MRMTQGKLRHRSVAEDRWQSDKGQSLIEAAIILPLLLFLVFAIVDFGVLFYVYQSMENGISEATRYGITGQQKPDPQNPGNYLSREESIKVVMREFNPSIVLNNSAFTFEHRELTGTTWDPGSGRPTDICRVTVNYSWRPIVPLISALFANGQVPLRVASTMKNEGFEP
jgi:hypothetical protein